MMTSMSSQWLKASSISAAVLASQTACSPSSHRRRPRPSRTCRRAGCARRRGCDARGSALHQQCEIEACRAATDTNDTHCVVSCGERRFQGVGRAAAAAISGAARPASACPCQCAAGRLRTPPAADIAGAISAFTWSCSAFTSAASGMKAVGEDDVGLARPARGPRPDRRRPRIPARRGGSSGPSRPPGRRCYIRRKRSCRQCARWYQK